MHAVTTLLPGLRRLTAANPSPMTFEGTNSYLIGEAEVIVVDPGPDDAGHRAALRAAIGLGRVQAILVTHAHLDHSAGAEALAKAVDAPVMARITKSVRRM